MSDLIERPTDAADPTYPDAERCAQTLEACEDDLLTEAQFVRWQGQEIERLTAERDELLEALHQLIAVIGLTAIKYKSDLDILQAAVDEASAAIAKAEGRQRC